MFSSPATLCPGRHRYICVGDLIEFTVPRVLETQRGDQSGYEHDDRDPVHLAREHAAQDEEAAALDQHRDWRARPRRRTVILGPDRLPALRRHQSPGVSPSHYKWWVSSGPIVPLAHLAIYRTKCSIGAIPTPAILSP